MREALAAWRSQGSTHEASRIGGVGEHGIRGEDPRRGSAAPPIREASCVLPRRARDPRLGLQQQTASVAGGQQPRAVAREALSAVAATQGRRPSVYRVRPSPPQRSATYRSQSLVRTGGSACRERL